MAEQRRGSDLVGEVRAKKSEAVVGGDEEVPEIPDVRATDLEPYVGLRYLSKLFKLMGVILGLLLVAEIVTGVVAQGSAAIPTLLGEASRLIVLAGLLWGVGDLAILLIDVGHDVRAARILLARQTHAVAGPVRRTEPANGSSSSATTPPTPGSV
jgi:hypothetical protein